jgi:Neuraminidase (sialidase)
VPPLPQSSQSSRSGDTPTLLVLAEARKYSCSDESPHSLVAKRSTDGGTTWSGVNIVVDPAVVWGPSEVRVERSLAVL